MNYVVYTILFTFIYSWFRGRNHVDPNTYKGKMYYNSYEGEEE